MKVCVTVLPDPFVPSPKFHAQFVTVLVLVQAVPVKGPPQLADPSKITGTFKLTGVGENVNAAVGVTGGGRMTPVGTSLIRTDSGCAVEKFVAVAVATIDTRSGRDELLPEAHGVKTPLGGAGGAVYTTVATPAALVTIARADSVPKSTATPFTLMSMRSGKPETGWPSGPMAVTLTDDCDPPS